ncbi:MAG: hypothetical protein ABW148_18620 [Sedimenticola sp.]
MSERIAMIKKLSTPKIMGKKPRLNEDEEKRDLYQIVGVASGKKTGESDFGIWCSLSGNFAAVNLITGEQFRSGVVFLPDVALDPILGQLDAGATAVEFGFTITIIADEDSATGYVYIATPLMEPDENDPLEALTAKFSPTEHLLEDKSDEKPEEKQDAKPDAKQKPAPKPKGKPSAK